LGTLVTGFQAGEQMKGKESQATCWLWAESE